MNDLMLRVAEMVRRMLRSLATVAPPKTAQMTQACCVYLIARAADATVNASNLSAALEILVSLDYQGTSGAQKVVEIMVCSILLRRLNRELADLAIAPL